jgi:hypothetical protein
MNAIVSHVPQNFGAVSARFAPVAGNTENDLSAGVAAGFGIIGYKGKVWSTRYRGTDTNLMRADGDGPMNSIEVVLLKASGHVSKIWYEAGYVEGSSAPPDCFSTNGVTPEAGAQKKQGTTCATCPMNAWGSRITPAGKQGKACSDSKRLAVTPLPDIPNEGLGGAMLLRVPAASLREIAAFGEKMQGLGYPYYAIGTRIAFDPAESYPKFVFSAIRPLTDAEADKVIAMRDSPAVARILAEGSENAAAPAPATVASAFEHPPVEQIAKPAPAPVAEKVAPVVQVAQAAAVATPNTAASGGFGGTPVVAAQTVAPVAQVTAAAATTAFELDLDAQLDALLPAA